MNEKTTGKSTYPKFPCEYDNEQCICNNCRTIGGNLSACAICDECRGERTMKACSGYYPK